MDEIGVKTRKSLSFVIRGCFRSVCTHPFLVGMLCFLIYLYRSSPFIFSLLVSASPVLICTALLLGTLLSFGQLNIPEIEEDKTSHEVASLKTSISEDATIHENDSDSVQRYSEKSREGSAQLSEEQSKFGEVHERNMSNDTAPLIKERSIEKGNGETCEERRELQDTKYKEKAEWYDGRLSDDEIVENHYSSIPHKGNDESVDSDDERSEADSFDSERVNVDSLDSPPRSPWKRVEEREEEEEEENVDEDVEEDEGSDSGSDGAESSSPDASMADIMPMLDELHPLLDEEAPQPIGMSANGSDVESESSSKSSVVSRESDEETENEEDSEVGEDENEDGDDEGVEEGGKEEEKKSAITWTDEDQKNLMDLGSSELERNQRLENLILRRRARKNMSMVPQRNLIDLESLDFPPFHVAPISTSRQNPFDISHDSYDNSGLPPIPGSAPSILLPRRNPFDIPYDSSEEKPNLVGEGLQEELITFQSREPFFRRHESFNVGPSIFAPSRQDVKLRPFFVPERMVSEESSYSPFQRQSSELSDSKVSSVPETESLGSVEDFEERKLTDEDNQPEPESLPSLKEESHPGDPEPESSKEEVTEEETEPISNVEHVSENVGHGSQSSEEEEEESLDGEAVEQRYIRESSSSSLSEVSERVFTETEEGRRNVNPEGPSISSQTSLESNDFRITSTVVDEAPHKEPVYDSSPPAVKNNMSSSSISSEMHPESDLLPPVLIKKMVSFVERESESSSSPEMEDVSNIEMLTESSSGHQVDEHESLIINVVDKREHDDIYSSDVSESSFEASVEESLIDQHREGEVPRSSSDENVHDEVKSSDDQNICYSMEDKHSVISGNDNLGDISGQTSFGELSVKHSIEKEETTENVQSPNSDSDVYLEAYEKLSLTPSAEGNAVSFFHDKPMHLPSFKHPDAVQACNTVAESSNEIRTIQEISMPGLQELDQDNFSNVNSPLSPDFISIPSTASDAASPHADVLAVVEEADEIKEIDEGILSELDSVGDFSVKQWGSGSEEMEKRINSVAESSSLVYHAESSTVRVVEVKSVEVNPIESSINSAINSREEMDIYEEDMENILEIQTSERCVAEHIDIPDEEYNERDGQDSPDQSSSNEDTPSLKNEVTPIYTVEHQTDKKTESASVEAGSSELLNQGEVEIHTSRKMPELEHLKIEDVCLAFRTNSDIEIEKSAVFETPRAELVIEANVSEHEKSAIFEPTQDERVSKETVTEHDKSAILVPTQAELINEESVIEHSVGNTNQEAPVLEVRSTEEAGSDKQVVENHNLPGSVDHVPHVLEPRDIQETSTDLHVAEPSSSVAESSVKEISAVAGENPDHDVQAHDHSHSFTTHKEKGKVSKSSSSKSSSSSSSSSSDSSSSDSDKE